MAIDGNPADEPRQEEPESILEQVRAYIEYQASAGLDAVPLPSRQQRADNDATSSRPEARAVPRDRGATVSVVAPASPPVSAAAPPVEAAVASAATLDELRLAIGECTRCKLAGGRTNLVFGVGNLQAQLMFVGEGPGRDEDLRGEPFVGRAGQLLTEIITKGMKLRREDVYIANVVKCRPPENRNPEPDEISACQPFLQRQIDIVAPKVIVALGKFAAQTLLAVNTPISRLRGNWFDYHGVPLMPTFHPAYLLHNPGDKRLVWEDIKQVMSELEKYA